MIKRQKDSSMSTQVTLTDAERQALETLSRRKGASPEDILHEAIADFLARHQTESRLDALRSARGLWQNRADLPALSELRSEWNRFEESA